MTAIFLYTTAPTLSEANLVLDTQINLLPFSPDLIRVNCAGQRKSNHGNLPATAPLVLSDQLNSVNSHSAWIDRQNEINAGLGTGQLVVIKNGQKVWPASHYRLGFKDAKEIHIVIMNSNWKQLDPPPNDPNARVVSPDILQSWPAECIIDSTNKMVLEIQNAFRMIIAKHLSPRRLTGLSADMMFKPYLHRQKLRVVIALGGLSECGKSSMGAFIDSHFGQQGRREKIGYLLDNATHQLGLNAYTLPDSVQAHLLLQQIESYSKAHFWLSVLSLESIHRFASIAEAKRILGPLLQIVYVDASEEKRIERQISRVEEAQIDAKIQELKDKDVVKRERGAERVKDIADLVLDNNGSFAEASSVLAKFISTKLAAT
ncbi:hypothetical protein B0H16DRAFT_1550399 [Mycena metata]|uniref:Uncharacterized protein n=1 Tax=Mycena metata TaxID=1033252 RepID=A0AAD7IVM7_9AGAR|nr:hypothetical protein B0H16DRAFT_1550399 [Mycena metata]